MQILRRHQTRSKPSKSVKVTVSIGEQTATFSSFINSRKFNQYRFNAISLQEFNPYKSPITEFSEECLIN